MKMCPKFTANSECYNQQLQHNGDKNLKHVFWKKPVILNLNKVYFNNNANKFL